MPGSKSRAGLARIYAPFFPFPPVEGGRWVISEQVRALTRIGWSVEVVTWLDTPAAVREAASRLTKDLWRVGIRHLQEPEVVIRPGGQRVDGATDLRSRPESRGTRLFRVLRALGSHTASPELFHYPPAVDRRARLPEAELGIYHYTFAHTWISRQEAPERRVIVHVHNRESCIAAVRASTAAGLSRRLHRRNARILARHERELPTLVDELWFVSLADMEALLPPASAADARLVPPTLPKLKVERKTRRVGDKPVLGFVGTLDFEPNLRGVEWLIRVLAPTMTARWGRPRIIVAGGGLPDSLRREGERAGCFEFRGYLEDLEPFWSELDGFLVPDLHGIGVRIKLLEAVARGIPTLTHSSAAAALSPDVASHPLLTVTDDPERWAERIETLADAPVGADPPPSLHGETTYRFLTRDT